MSILKNKYILSVLKIFFGLMLLAILWKTGKLDYKNAFKVFQTPEILISVTLCFLGILFIGSYRWKKILEFHSTIKFNPKDIFFIQWIGGFFSSALPGAVTGDLIKLGYIKKHDPSLSKRFLLFSVIMDRVLGLWSLLFIAGMGSLFFYEDLILMSENFKNIIFINGVLFLVMFVGVGIFFVPNKIQNAFLAKSKIEKINNLLIQLWSLSDKKGEFAKLFIASAISHTLSLCAFHLLNLSSYEGIVALKHLTTIIPLGQVATAIPISPSGLGVGHAAYQKLFEYLKQQNGATLFNNFWVFSTTFFVLGAFPYFFMSARNKKPNID